MSLQRPGAWLGTKLEWDVRHLEVEVSNEFFHTESYWTQVTSRRCSGSVYVLFKRAELEPYMLKMPSSCKIQAVEVAGS